MYYVLCIAGQREIIGKCPKKDGFKFLPELSSGAILLKE